MSADVGKQGLPAPPSHCSEKQAERAPPESDESRDFLINCTQQSE